MRKIANQKSNSFFRYHIFFVTCCSSVIYVVVFLLIFLFLWTMEFLFSNNCCIKELVIMKMENSNSNIVELCSDHRKKNDHKRKNGSRTTNDMSQTVCLFKKYLLARAQYDNIGKTNTEESEVINKSPHRHLLPIKFSRNSLSRPPSLLERNLVPELRYTTSFSMV